MRVNRIYFRGLKTFEWGFAISLLVVFLAGCQSSGNIRVEIVPIALNPRIVDVRVTSTCLDPQVFVSSTGGEKWIQLRTNPQKIGESSPFTARLTLGLDADDSVDLLRVRVECSTQSQHFVEYQVPKNTFQILSTPDWAKGLVWYQVFPERFRDGNPRNNPNNWDVTPIEWDRPFAESSQEEIERAWNRRLVDPRQFRSDPDRSGGSTASLVYSRRYGGDLQGVYEQLESLRDQGYTGIYLCPVFQSRSLHKYDASDHRHIDPTLGHPGIYIDPGPGHTALQPHEDPLDETTWEWTTSDQWFIDVFLPKAKSLGLKVVLDGVWNHVGLDHFAFADVVEKGAASEFADWFVTEFDDNGKLIAWQGWNRVNGNLPEFRKVEGEDLADEPRAHVMAVTRRWMDPNNDGDPSDGIDGWRLDVAGEIGAGFWKDWRMQVRSINPDALVIGEIWSDADRMMNNEGFDGQMNYPFAYGVADWLSIGNTKGDAQVLADRLTRVFHHEPQHDLVQFNLMTSHDTERLASMMHNDFERGYDNDASRWGRGSRYDAETIDEDDLERALAAIAIMVASPGSVMIYNGDDYGLPGADDPDNRRPIPWNEIAQDGSIKDHRAVFHAQVNALLQLREDHELGAVLRYGSVQFSSRENALVIERQLDDLRVEFIVSMNGVVSEKYQATLGSEPDASVHERVRKFGLYSDMVQVFVRY